MDRANERGKREKPGGNNVYRGECRVHENIHYILNNKCLGII